MSRREVVHEQQADPPELVAFNALQERRGLAPLTISARARLVHRLAAYLEGRPLTEAIVADLRAFVASRREHLAASSQVTEINYLQDFYGGLLELGLIEHSPAAGLRSWRVSSTRRPLSLLQVRALLLEASRQPPGRGAPALRQALAQRDRACLELLFATGVRASELCAARVVDLDLEEGSLWVRRAKGGRGRRLPLPGAAVAALREYTERARVVLRAARADPGALFLTRDGQPLKHGSLLALVKRVGRRAGVAAFPHVFRRTLATELARAGVGLPVIQKVLGHAHLSTTQDYVSVSFDDLREAIDELDRTLPRGQSGVSVLGNLQRHLFPEWQTGAA